MKLICSSEVSGPFSMGMFGWSRCLVLPADKYRKYQEDQLRMIFAHELHHLQRADVETKCFLVFITSLCWINPLVWIGAKMAAEDLELSCDEIVTEQMNATERKQYALLLLNTASPSTGFTTCLSAAASTLKYRMKNVVDIRRKSIGVLWVAAALFICIVCYGVIGITTEKGNFTELFIENSPRAATWSLEVENATMDEDNQFSICKNPDNTAIMNELSHIQLQKMETYDTYSSHTGDNISFQFWDPDGYYVRIYLYKDIVHVDKPEYDDQYYKIVSGLDWDALTAALQ